MKTKVIFILGHAFSGSTLFSLALGTEKRILNLGEVSSLEHDYYPRKICTCGSRLIDCVFWNKLKAALEQSKKKIPVECHWHLDFEALFCSFPMPTKHYKTIVLNIKD